MTGWCRGGVAGRQCRNLADRVYEGVACCHIHDPNGAYARKHPEYTPALVRRLKRAVYQMPMIEVNLPE